MKIAKTDMIEMETFIRKCIHYAIKELEQSDDAHKKSIENLIKSAGNRDKLEINCFRYYINSFENCSNLKYLSEVSIEGILARAVEMAQFIFYKPDIKFAIKVSDGKIEMIDTVIDPFFIKRQFQILIEDKCRVATFPAYISANAFHYLDRINKEHLPRDPLYFESYGVNIFYKIIEHAKQDEKYINIQYEKEDLRMSYITEIAQQINLDLTGNDIKHIDFFMKKQKN